MTDLLGERASESASESEWVSKGVLVHKKVNSGTKSDTIMAWLPLLLHITQTVVQIQWVIG